MGRLAPRVTAAVALVVLAIAVAVSCGGRSAPPATAKGAAAEFLDKYLDDDGRVVRRDQGGDTVSEGQAYAMLLSVVSGDQDRFGVTWRWTREHLRRPDGLLAWHWADGRVADAQPASDADLDAAHALALAARRFREPRYARDARALATAIDRHETASDGVLVAGPWARDAQLMDPSYFSPLGLQAVGLDRVRQATHDRVAWLVAAGAPPPDWATVGPPPTPAAAPGGSDGGEGGGRYGFDAARLPIRLAASCDPRDRKLAAGFRLQGAAPASHPVFTVAEAAQAHAAGERARAAALLDRAARDEEDSSTYYGAAWVALGRALLQTDLLGPCPSTR